MEILHRGVKLWLQPIGVWVRSKVVRLRARWLADGPASTVQVVANMIAALSAIFMFLALKTNLNNFALVAEAVMLAAGLVSAAAQCHVHCSTERSRNVAVSGSMDSHRFRPDAEQDEGGSPGVLQVPLRSTRDPNDSAGWPRASSSEAGNGRTAASRPPPRDTYKIDMSETIHSSPTQI